MPRTMNVITEKELAFIVVATTLNRFDFYTIIDGERGLGKDVTTGELVHMSDGTIKKVEDVRAGDKVISPQKDGSFTFERINEVHSYLSDDIYEVREVTRDKRLLYSCVGVHNIPVYKKRSRRNGPGKPRTIWFETMNYPAMELAKRYTKSSHWMGFTSPMVEFENQKDPTIDPYFLGVHLGDGSYTKSLAIKLGERKYDIISELKKAYSDSMLPIRITDKNNSQTVYTIPFSMKSKAALELTKYGLRYKKSGTKFIPKECLVASKEYRLKLFAGLLDSDGYIYNCQKNGRTKKFALSATSIEYITKSDQMAEDIKNLVHSLGGFCRMSKKIGRFQNNFSAEYNRLRISFNDPTILPLKCAHKKEALRGKYKHDPTHIAIEVVKTDRKERVYGFSITGESKWFITSNWMVTHNSTVGFKLAKNVSAIYRKLYRGDIKTLFNIYKILISENTNYTLGELIEQLTFLKSSSAYQFRPRDNLIYDQNSARIALDDWNSIAMFDEFVNIGYSRDFFDRGQKDLIKLLNLNRDHTNLTIACIPHFLTADNQLRNLCKLRIYVHRRGEAVILSPNRGMSVRDRWDTDLNSKIENDWRKKGVKNPQWTRLTTFRAVMKTYPLTKEEEKVYQQIKNDKRNNLIIKEEKETDPIRRAYVNVYEDLISLKIKSYDELNGAAIGIGVTPETLRRNIKKILKENKKLDDLPSYFEEKVKKKQIRDLEKQKADKSYEGMTNQEIIAERRMRRASEAASGQ